jgi:hypothetical protein
MKFKILLKATKCSRGTFCVATVLGAEAWNRMGIPLNSTSVYNAHRHEASRGELKHAVYSKFLALLRIQLKLWVEY